MSDVLFPEPGVRHTGPKWYPLDRQPCGCTGQLPDAEDEDDDGRHDR